MYVPAIGLTNTQVSYILSLRGKFKEVESATGVPWQAVAAIWTRESFSVAPPKTPGGPFQFDPPLGKSIIRAVLKQYSSLSMAKIEEFATKGVNDFETGAYCCAAWLRIKCKPVLTVDSSDDVIKDAMYGYNGRAYGGADKSPYVMNGYDKDHVDMHLKGTIPDGKGGRKKIDVVDKRPGAFTVYKQLKALPAWKVS